jgi:hypothetical protein
MNRDLFSTLADIMTIVIVSIELVREVVRVIRRMRQESKKRQSGD